MRSTAGPALLQWMLSLARHLPPCAPTYSRLQSLHFQTRGLRDLEAGAFAKLDNVAHAVDDALDRHHGTCHVTVSYLVHAATPTVAVRWRIIGCVEQPRAPMRSWIVRRQPESFSFQPGVIIIQNEAAE